MNIHCWPLSKAFGNVVKRALKKAGLPSVLEPPGLDRGEGPRPDDITVFPFSGGRTLVWNCTCADTFAGVHLKRSTIESGTASCKQHRGEQAP